ncbi:hypothetical protein GGD41_003305 [Paraburkholderia bryophila]|uniref:Uncharacterized protein n=1 Tax=Paraburkholderia bryophila TaxID=420952 RepID=A0A7Y9W8B1_9BURK|nr:hypothetical protein [Paraburkholderia bryophila]
MGLLGSLHQFDDLAERRLLARVQYFDSQRTVEIHRAAEHRRARVDIERHRLPGDRRIVDARLTMQHHTVGGDTLAGRDFDPVAGLQRFIRHFFERAVRADAPHLARRQAAERADRFLRAEHAAFFERVAEGHHDRQQGGSGHVADCPGRQHRERDQAVGHAVQTRRLEAVPRARKHRTGDDQRRQSREHLRQRFIGGRERVPGGRQYQQAACQ